MVGGLDPMYDVFPSTVHDDVLMTSVVFMEARLRYSDRSGTRHVQ